MAGLGDPFTFWCTVFGNRNGVTIWTVNVGGTLECPLSHIVAGSVRCGPNNEFTARPGTGFGPGTSATSFTSTDWHGNPLTGWHTGGVLWTSLFHRCSEQGWKQYCNHPNNRIVFH